MHESLLSMRLSFMCFSLIAHCNNCHRDNEKAYVSLNGKQCWTKSFDNGAGTQVCGSGSNNWEEERVKVQCQGIAVNGKLTVRVWTNLNSAANDESFGIDAVVVKRIKADVSDKFNDPNDFRGWNCGKIQKCGAWGNICGGYGVKGKGADIKKTFHLPAGTYSIRLDFIKIDSWFVRRCQCL